MGKMDNRSRHIRTNELPFRYDSYTIAIILGGGPKTAEKKRRMALENCAASCRIAPARLRDDRERACHGNFPGTGRKPCERIVTILSHCHGGDQSREPCAVHFAGAGAGEVVHLRSAAGSVA